jgi:Flp pilus assembly protein TadD
MSQEPKRNRRRKRDPQLIREEVLRPSHYLGYDRDQIGVHLLSCEAYELAESQFRRAVWLNPYHPGFKVHWAIALIKLGRKDEAHSLLQTVLRENPNDEVARLWWGRYWAEEPPPNPEGTTPAEA